MLTMDQIHHIRALYYEQGYNISEIAEATGRDWKTVAKYIDMADFNEPLPVPASEKKICPKLEPYKATIDSWLEEDKNHRRKQRHTATKVYNLLKREIELRDQAHIDNLIKDAKFPVQYSFDQFRTDEVEFPDDCTLETLKSLQFLREHKNIIMYGGTGTGKTMLSICIGLLACKRDIPVRFFRTASLVNTLSSKMKAGKLDSFRDKLSKASIYVINEFGYVPYDRDGINILFDFLSEISDDPGKVVILNTNLEFSRWVNVLYDQKMTAALIGRLTHHCHLILFPGENNRLKESSINMIYRSITDRQERIQRH